MNIVYGICGIGHGHVYRQLPIIDELLQLGHRLAFVANGNSYRLLQQRYPQCITLMSEVEWLPDREDGIDWAKAGANQVERHNYQVLEQLSQLPRADLVLSDYEPVCARYAYAYDRPLVTIDQQSKFLGGQWDPIAGLNPLDEQMRLRLLFPRADLRIACSFFAVQNSSSRIVAPTFRSALQPSKLQREYHCAYISSQASSELQRQMLQTLVALHQPVRLYGLGVFQQGLVVGCSHQQDFIKDLTSSQSLIATAGHSLLSEAMMLGLPVCAVPFGPYEQHLNAQTIAQAGFGCQGLQQLPGFVEQLEVYRHNIQQDKDVLLRGNATKQIVAMLMQL